MASEILFMNHASVLIHCDGQFVLTDPWLDIPAFGCWLPVPPLAVHPVYLTTLARSCPEGAFSIVVSHGHDDHLDDVFLSRFPLSTPIFMPKYAAKGLRARIAKIGFQSIHEVDELGMRHGDFQFSSAYNLANSHDDGILTIETSDAVVVHANDNWRKLTDEASGVIRSKIEKLGSKRSLYLSQCNIADAFPYIYPQFPAAEKTEIAHRRISDMTKSSLRNALSVGAGYFMNYAGHTKSLVQSQPDLEKLTGYRTYDFISTQLEKYEQESLKILDMVPGDRFDFQNVIKQFGNVRLDDASLKEESIQYYRSTGLIDRCVDYQEFVSPLKADQRRKMLRDFLGGFGEFVRYKIEQNGFRREIKKQNFSLGCEEEELRFSVNFNTGAVTEDPTLPYMHINASASILDRVLLGQINMECLTIGGACEIFREPTDFYNGHVHFWLSMYGYSFRRKTLSAF